MSRIGRKAIKVSDKVKVTQSGRQVHVEGPLGKLDLIVPEGVHVKVEGGIAHVGAPPKSRSTRGHQGMVRAIVANMVSGVTVGYQKDLEINGVGYKADLRGDTISFALGYTHPVSLKLPKGISAIVDKTQTKISIKGADKQMVGQIAAQIRSFKKPEPYKGKGVKYATEVIKRKVGKTGAK
jgi:large subunit ribosomal protein L6